jgi:glycosyltransferase involved in cell wall biosynthesis
VDSPTHPRTLAYLCLQATREGQASHAHVHEIIAGLERRRWKVSLFEPSYARAVRPPGVLRRLVAFTSIQMKCIRAASRADIVYVRAHFAALPTAAWALWRHKPIVQELNGTYDDVYLAWPGFKMLRPLLVSAQRRQIRSATLVIAVTEGLATWAQREAKAHHVATVPNGANTDLFTPDGPLARDLPPRFVCFVGGLARWQGVDVMLEATRDPQWPAGVPLVIVGDGACAAEVRAAAKESDRISYLGPVPYRSVPSIVRGATAMLSVQPSLRRTTTGGIHPLKVFEALACAVPVIVTDHPGQADLVRAEGCGWIVPPDDPAAVARAVAEAIADPDFAAARGLRGRETVLREHSWDARAAATHSLLRDLLDEAHA